MAHDQPDHEGVTLVRRTLLPAGLLVFGVLLTTSEAQITLDGSLGPAGPLVGPHYVIPAAVGETQSSNLFHSFGQFNVHLGESATFTGPNSIANILSRVTGGEPSAIDGLLRSTIPGANLFLLNPAGVLFGPHARLEVSGSLHVSTADYLRLADGGIFSATLAQGSVLTAAPPAAFGFLGPNPAPMIIQESVLQVPEGKTLSIVGGDITIEGGTLQASSGQITLASVGSAGEVPVNVAEFNVDTFERLGAIELSAGALLDVSGDSGGTVVIRGGNLLVDNSSIFADTRGTQDGAPIGIDIHVTGDMVVTNGSEVTAGTFGAGDAGDIVIEAKQVTLTGGALIDSSTLGPGQGGTITVTATDSVLITGPDSGLFTDATSSGAGGNITLEAREIQLREGAVISATSTGEGNAGDITLIAWDTFQSVGSAVTTAAETADGGNIHLTAGFLVDLVDSQLTATVRSGEGQGGNITIDPTFVILEHSAIRADAFGGPGGNIRIVADVFLASPDSEVSASSTLGIQGTVEIQAPMTNLSGTLAPLPQVFVSAGALLQEPCAVRLRGGQTSSLVFRGREGLPLEPGGVLPSPLEGVGTVSRSLAGEAEPREALLGWEESGLGFTPVALASGCTK
ncbi:MAG: filamentous hemagglutinin N-terminal domain-containing protein [candidate division NC10 bacterium]|nr:filamentous hemagglutinin N-terminal domain-containing protein [candidate division NC10 bacterium]